MFQFQYGAIRSNPRLLFVLLSYNSFNSSMVRLGAGCKTHAELKEASFQFQYGAIRRLISYSSLSLLDKFQFQYGAIRSDQIFIDNYGTSGFQFQYGAIRRKNISICPRSKNQVSIPVWCD